MKNWDVLISYLRLPVLVRLLLVGSIMIVFFGTLIHFVEPSTFRNVFDGIWWAIVTTATIGYGDIVPKTFAGKIVAISLILLGTGVITTYFATLSAAAAAKESMLSSGQLRYMQKGHIIIVGWNERAREVIAKLTKYHSSLRCVIIDATLQELPVSYKNVHFIKGNASYDDVLHKANIAEAQMILITADQHKNEAEADKDSILTLLAAKGLNPCIYAIVEILTEQQVNNAKRAGADEVIQTNLLSSFAMANSLQSPGVSKATEELLHQLHNRKLQLIDVEGLFIGKTFFEISQILLDKQIILIGIMRGEEGYINPSPHFLIEKGDRLFVIMT
ncbi:potassium channel family protein [Parageobacillus toebii]|uniref:potassium channel family protein n=1 Tax=Parageobacillus toebii TaxID=153151 RepID=UPI002E1FDDE5|nr:potassium channel protein [Parageobacillus toebii]